MEFARNAGVMEIGIPTGFDSREDLIKAGANVMIENIKDLQNVLN